MKELSELNTLNKLRGLSKFKKKLIITAIFIVIIVIIAVVLFFKGYSSAQKKYQDELATMQDEINRLSDPTAAYTEASKEVSIDVINSELQDIGEIVTQEYIYTNAGKFSDAKKMFGKDVPLTKKSFVAKWDGSIKAGIAAGEITTEMNQEEKTITVFLPDAKIISHDFDSDSMEILDEKDGLFNEIEIENFVEFETVSKEEMEERAIENGILTKAYENAQNVIYKLIYTDVVAEAGYSIVFESASE